MVFFMLLKSKITFVQSFTENFLSFCHDFVASGVFALITIWPWHTKCTRDYKKFSQSTIIKLFTSQSDLDILPAGCCRNP